MYYFFSPDVKKYMEKKNNNYERSDFIWYLKAVQFGIAKYMIVILVRNVKYSAEGSDTCWF